MKEKLFTKSVFKLGITCPTQMYYARHPELYANAQLDDEFLESLAKGGFQVGEAAKVYLEVPEENDIKSLDYEESLAITKRLLEQENVKIAEAAFRYGDCFVRTDILVKKGHQIDLIEVKSHSFNSADCAPREEGGNSAITSDLDPYIEDVTLQRWVVDHALKEMYPNEEFKITAFLMMPDKVRKAPIGGINQMFKIVEKNGRKSAVRTPEAAKLVGTDPVVVPLNVDWLAEFKIGENLPEDCIDPDQPTYEEFVNSLCEPFMNDECLNSDIGAHCFKCPFHRSPGDDPELRDGFCECWNEALGWTEEDFKKPRISDLNGQKAGYIKKGILFLDDMPVPEKAKIDDSHGVIPKDRNILIAGMLTGREELLAFFKHNIHGDTYLNIPALQEEMNTWVYPLHMIDFETSAVALPFYEGMRPYESVAFQYSHHIIRKTADGYTIEHAGQFINVEKGHFPNFDFIRALKADLEKDGGSIFRYSYHENTILRHIARQLAESTEPDKDELIEFIKSITYDSATKWKGPRNMIDLWDVVKKCFYHPSMRGSYSIKAVLPAVLNTSKFIQEKYSKPIYGSEIKSLNIPSSEPKTWIEYEEDGKTVKNPYKLLPPVAEYMGIDQATFDKLEDEDDMTVANGGAALTAYSELQFVEGIQSKALATALLHYCELDTMAMVFIWEYFYHEVYGA